MGALKEQLYEELEKLEKSTGKEPGELEKEWREDEEKSFNNFIIKQVKSIKKIKK